ncbi:hypothetical protein LZ31DRAFT_159607 [Colletotrichum somersetense]|nr:hypothetical protein LZ31DRAFT_159607 [Colletotrichum somersetense]
MQAVRCKLQIHTLRKCLATILVGETLANWNTKTGRTRRRVRRPNFPLGAAENSNFCAAAFHSGSNSSEAEGWQTAETVAPEEGYASPGRVPTKSIPCSLPPQIDRCGTVQEGARGDDAPVRSEVQCSEVLHSGR